MSEMSNVQLDKILLLLLPVRAYINTFNYLDKQSVLDIETGMGTIREPQFGYYICNKRRIGHWHPNFNGAYLAINNQSSVNGHYVRTLIWHKCI